jgi:hypothetical protein
MSKTDRERVRGELEQEIGSRATALVMELVPPMDWDAVATKQDLAVMERRFDVIDERIVSLRAGDGPDEVRGARRAPR